MIVNAVGGALVVAQLSGPARNVGRVAGGSLSLELTTELDETPATTASNEVGSTPFTLPQHQQLYIDLMSI